MITVFGGIKGGTGKTTLCTNICVIQSLLGKKILLVDGDEQNSASDWAENREALGIETPWTTIRLFGKSLYPQILRLQKDYEEILIDVGGRDTTTQRAALAAADCFVTPFPPRTLDIWTLGKLVDLIQDVVSVNPKLISYAVLNQAEPRVGDNETCISYLKETGSLICYETFIGQRKAFSNAAAEGQGVVEMTPQNKKAVHEIQNLNDLIYQTKVH